MFRAQTLLLVALVFFVVVSAVQWGRPAIEDEILFHRDAYSWATQGANLEGLSHTPLYWEAMRWWQKIFGVANPADPASVKILRSLGTASALATVFIFFAGLTLLYAADSALAFVALLLVHPYFIQSSLLLDIDNTILIPALLLWVVLVELWDRRPEGSWPMTFAIAAVFGVAMMIKELTPLLCLPLWVFYSLLRPVRHSEARIARHLSQALVGCVLGVLISAGLLWLWTSAVGVEFLAPLKLTTEKLARGDGNLKSRTPWGYWGWTKLIFLDYLPLVWVGIPTLFGFALLFRRPRIRSILGWPLALWFAGGIFAAYSWIVQVSFYFPKYSAPALVLLLFGLAQKAPRLEDKKASPLVAVVLAALFLIGLVPQLDPLMIAEWRELKTQTIALHATAIALPCVLLFLLKNMRSMLAAGIVLQLAGLSFGQALRERNTGYMYGEAGLKETIQAVRELKARVSPDRDVISTARDIAWNAGSGFRYVELQHYEDYQERKLDDAQIIVSRSYGQYAIRSHARAAAEVKERYPCHEVVPTPGGRFEWWWIPLKGQSCK